MNREDKRRYLIVGSIILEIVCPLLRKKLEENFQSKGFGCLEDFINSLPVKHILFHLRHKNSQCCVDEANCFNLGLLPLNYSQWKKLYKENPGPKGHHCYCKYTAEPIALKDLDITLASLILMNCCALTPNENTLISNLREFKNNYLSHNTDGTISETEYNTFLTDLTTYVLQLDPSKQGDLSIIQNRPLDESLCEKYVTCLLDVHVILEKIDSKIDATAAEIRTTIGNRNTEVMETIGTKTAELLATIGINNVVLMAKLEEVLRNMICKRCKGNLIEQDKQEQPVTPSKLGQSIFTLQQKIDLTSKVSDPERRGIQDIVMMDDGRLVMCLGHQNKLLICNTDGEQVDRINLQMSCMRVTAVNNSTVVVTLYHGTHIEMYDINNKLKIKQISIKSGIGKNCWREITTIHDKLVVSDFENILIIDHQTGEEVQKIKTNCYPLMVHGSGDIIFYCDYRSNNMYSYSYTDERHQTLTLPSIPKKMTTLQDDSLYVVCEDGSVQHVSSDGKQYTTVTSLKLQNPKDRLLMISYNSKKGKLATSADLNGKFNVFHEI